MNTVPALLAVAFVDAHLGEVDRAREYATAAVEVAERAGVPFAVIEARTILGFAALSEGDAPGAHDHLAAALRHRRELGFHEPVWAHLAWSELDALVELGDLDPAEALARGLRERGQRFGHPYPLATAARGHALVLATRGDLGGARAELDRALTEHDRLGWPFERARTLLTLGVVLRRDKQKRAARETLHQALAIFEDLGARLWAAKVTAELARIGGWPAATGSLTVTERRVARLVADGHTNREVADLLFLSTKTVAAHLTSIYAKVGVRSRTELSRYLSPDDPDT
ncbi:MAG: hypothetical protein AUI14_24645 [Actinobacteria bacterium 13_2_20CM_2_71_6]|nr:MAG: hypothetical protein AUI14_24645 [Actinobacteria bacterium 13_2_20CM_2_71_6]